MGRSAAASFLGSHTNRIDGKGRIAAPADFRRALDLASFQGFFCLPSLEGPYLECGGEDFIEGLKASIGALDPFDEDRRALERALLGQARPVSIDGDGRFILPEPLRGHAALEDKALFVGLGDTFQIQRPPETAAPSADDVARARAALRRLRNPGAPPAPPFGAAPGSPDRNPADPSESGRR